MSKDQKIALRINTMAIILIVIFSIAISPVTLQNDTFYTIKIGEYVLENGVTMQEPFAWHNDLEYTFPHWAYDVLIYSIYNIGGMTGIYISTIVFASILGISMYIISVKLNKNRIISMVLTLITLYLLKPYICARAQLITFILFIFTIYFIEKFLETRKIKYAIGLIIIPILIANLHLATFYFYFILYLPYIAEYMMYVLAYSNTIISKSVVDSINKKIKKQGETAELLEKLKKAEEKSKKLQANEDARIQNPYKIKTSYSKNIKYLLIILVIALLTGFLTPLGTTPYTYLIKTMQGISTKNISEHLPVVLANNTALLILLGVYLGILIITKVKIRASDAFMLVGLALLTIFSRRQSSMLFLIGVFILNRLISELMTNYNKDTIKVLEEKTSKIISIIIISTIVIAISIFLYKEKADDKYINESSYPVQASSWIKENLDVENIKLYNEYNFGSYLIYENIPVFIDSRCDLYMPEFNENTYVFKDFLNLSNANLSYKEIEDKIEEYGFTHFIISNGRKLGMYFDFNEDKYKLIYPTGDIEDKNFKIYEKIDREEI